MPKAPSTICAAKPINAKMIKEVSKRLNSSARLAYPYAVKGQSSTSRSKSNFASSLK
jgi:hypothetical protein